VVLLIGTNNAEIHSAAEILEGVRAAVARVRARAPEARVLVMALFPRGRDAADAMRRRVAEVNGLLPALADGERVKVLDLTSRFLRPDGTLPAELMPDFLHPSPAGYRIWAESIEPWVRQSLGGRRAAGRRG
jgi:lysophospholipase L1-like esterase